MFERFISVRTHRLTTMSKYNSVEISSGCTQQYYRGRRLTRNKFTTCVIAVDATHITPPPNPGSLPVSFLSRNANPSLSGRDQFVSPLVFGMVAMYLNPWYSTTLCLQFDNEERQRESDLHNASYHHVLYVRPPPPLPVHFSSAVQSLPLLVPLCLFVVRIPYEDYIHN